MFEYHKPNQSWLDRLERRLSWLAIPRLPVIILAGQAFFTAFGLSDPNIGANLYFDPVLVAQGQWWRIVTFVMIPSTTPMGMVFAFFWFSFFWFVCQSLEAQWGAFRTSLYILIGWAAQLLLSLAAWRFWGVSLPQEGRLLFLSLQLAFAWYFPDYTIYIYFILPLRMRTVAWISGAFLLYQAVTGWPFQALVIAASLVNYLLFFAADHAKNIATMSSSGLARAEFNRKSKAAKLSMPAKACQACGKDANERDIRLCTCSRCGDEGKFWCVEDLKEHLI